MHINIFLKSDMSRKFEFNFFIFQYLCELSMLEADPFLNYLPSTIAASAVVLSLHTLGHQSWVNLTSLIYTLYYQEQNNFQEP